MRLVEPWMDAFLDWFWHAAEFDGMTGAVAVRDWPRPGGVMEQFSKLVAAVDVVKAEVRFLPKPETKAETREPQALERKRGSAR